MIYFRNNIKIELFYKLNKQHLLFSKIKIYIQNKNFNFKFIFFL